MPNRTPLTTAADEEAAKQLASSNFLGTLVLAVAYSVKREPISNAGAILAAVEDALNSEFDDDEQVVVR